LLLGLMIGVLLSRIGDPQIAGFGGILSYTFRHGQFWI